MKKDTDQEPEEDFLGNWKIILISLFVIQIAVGIYFKFLKSDENKNQIKNPSIQMIQPSPLPGQSEAQKK